MVITENNNKKKKTLIMCEQNLNFCQNETPQHAFFLDHHQAHSTPAAEHHNIIIAATRASFVRSNRLINNLI